MRLLVGLAVAALCAFDGALYNTDMVAAPDPAEPPGTGRVVTYHQGVGEVATGYFKKHAPGEVAEFHLFVPDGVQPGARYPLLIVYHGGKDGQSGRGFAKSFGRVSTKAHPVFVLSPNMYTIESFNEIVKEGKHPIDLQRVVVMGFSSGGMGVGAAMKGWSGYDRPFAAFVMMSTFGAPPKGLPRDRQIVVVAGEHETPEHQTHPALKQRRDGCRKASLTLFETVREARYIEMRGHGHTATKTEHIHLLRNLIRGLGTARFRYTGAQRDGPGLSIARAEAEDWAGLRADVDPPEAGEARSSKENAALSRLQRDLDKWVGAQAKTLAGCSPKSSHLAKTQALHTYDNLQRLRQAFHGHAWGDRFARHFTRIENAKHLAREREARTRWEQAVLLGDHEKLTAALQKLRAEMADTEYGKNRTRETLLALGG